MLRLQRRVRDLRKSWGLESFRVLGKSWGFRELEMAAPPLGGRLFVFVVFGEFWVFCWESVVWFLIFGDFEVEVGYFGGCGVFKTVRFLLGIWVIVVNCG